MSEQQLIRASTVMALGTVFSRLTGLIRNLLLVALLGTAILGDTYNVANTMPNILYNLLIGGALTAVFVPQIVRSLRDSDAGAAFISRLFTVTITFLFLLTAIGIVLAPFIVNLYAPEFSGRPEFDVTVSFMRYCLPQIFFLGLFALLGQIANAKGKFGPMMWAPVLNNLIAILLFSYFLINKEVILLGNISDRDITLLGLGTTAGYLAQAVVLLPVVMRSGIRLTLKFDWYNSQILKSFRLASWSFLYAVISQISYLVTVSIATTAAVKSSVLGDSTGVGFTPYANAYLILILPHSIITVSIVTALLPRLSNYVIDKKYNELTASLTKVIKLVGIFTVPAALIFLCFGQLVANTLYFGISNEDANYLGLTLSAFALGLIPVSINLVLLRGLNAFENIKSQVIGNFVMNLIAIALSYLIVVFLEPKWVTVGLAVIFTLHYFIGVMISFYLIKRHQINLPFISILFYYLKLILIFALVITPIWFFQGFIPGGNLISLLLVTTISTVFYLLIAKVFKITQVTDLLNIIMRRKV